MHFINFQMPSYQISDTPSQGTEYLQNLKYYMNIMDPKLMEGRQPVLWRWDIQLGAALNPFPRA